MIIALDSMAEKYGMLPSELIQKASTFDLYVMNSANEWKNRQHEMSANGVNKNIPHLSQDEMKSMIESVKNPERKNG